MRVARATGGQIQSIAHSKQVFYPRAAYMPQSPQVREKQIFWDLENLSDRINKIKVYAAEPAEFFSSIVANVRSLNVEIVYFLHFIKLTKCYK